MAIPPPHGHRRRWLLYVPLLAAAVGAVVLLFDALTGDLPPVDPDRPAARDEARGPGRGDGSDRATESRPDAAGGPALPDSPRPRAKRGESRFQGRLQVGQWLRDLQDGIVRGEVTERQLAAALYDVREGGGLLAFDAWTHLRTRVSAGGVEGYERRVLEGLVEPSRDPEGLVLSASADPVDVLGRGARLRVWTQGRVYDPAEVQVGDALLRRLAEVAGDPSAHGYDVVATPGMGREVFPDYPFDMLGLRAIGLFSPRDDLCLIQATLSPRLRPIVLKHELVHAWTYRIVRRWKSRFVTEGLAEYLSRLRTDDVRFAVPLSRLRDNFAALLTILERFSARGIDLKTASFQRLVQASPAQHYALGYLGYLLGQAAVAYVGPDTVEAALKARSERMLADALSRIEWPALLEFVGTHAEGGTPEAAIVVEGVPTVLNPEVEARVVEFGSSLRARKLQQLGVTFDGFVSDARLEFLLRTPNPSDRQGEAGLRRFLDAFGRAADNQVVVLTDLSPGMKRPVRPASLPEGIVDDPEGTLAGAHTGTTFVAALHAALERSRGVRLVPLVGWGGTLTAVTRPLVLGEAYRRSRDLVPWLERNTTSETMLVVVVASRSMDRMVDTAQALGASLQEHGSRLSTVLVVDLAPGSSDAVDLVDALEGYVGPRGSATYWNPAQPLR